MEAHRLSVVTMDEQTTAYYCSAQADVVTSLQKTKCEPFITRKKSIQANEITSVIAVMQRLWQIATPTVTVPLEGADSTST
jgi:hypothetical protein